MLKQKHIPGILLVTIVMFLSIIVISPQIVIADDDPADEVELPEIDEEGRRLVLASDEFSIEVNGGGQIPYYHFNTTAEDVSFFLKFQRIVQYADSNDNNRFDEDELVGDVFSTLQLTSIDWDLELLSQSSTNVDFALTSSQIRNPLFSDVKLALVNHFSGGSSAIKFDVNITNWPFVEEATGLSLEFELMWSSEAEGPLDEENELIPQIYKESTDSGIYIKNTGGTVLAYFESVSEINVDGTTIVDGATLNDTAVEKANKLNVYINYPKFENYVLHDPMFGTSLDALKNPSAIILWFKENVKAGFLGITALTTIFLATFFVVNRRKRT
ncbi:hypothetical protein CEE45_10635 [Candidatus Heimdallarchaeota archaeon B3_Heim]|nr:MAG: hypothetical protein CEE45_10635 [Candidatus Heimdallarchaeota archaeon B3_Heim]